nr:PKD domain-containing protein [Saprospiraceae bacterium]
MILFPHHSTRKFFLRVFLMSQLFFTLFCTLSLSQDCTAAFTWDDTDLTIQFTDLSTSQNGNIVSWFWDFDDGTTSTEQNPLHTFPEVDKYDVELEIMDDQGCTNDIKIRIEICVLNIEYSVGDCDPDNNLPIDITVYDVYDNADEIEIFIDGDLFPGGPFDISENEPVTIDSEIPGDGLEHTITVISDDIETCVSEVSFIVEDCSSDCFLSAMSTEIENTGSQTVLVGGNFFDPENTNLEIGETVIFQWIDGGHSTTSDATSGPDSWNSGVISGPTYEVDLLNPGIHPYYCTPHGGPGGSGMSGTLIADCPPGDLFNVIVSFNTSIADPQGFRIYLDGDEVPGSPFDYDGTGPQSETIEVLGDGLIHDIMVEDVNDPTCTLEKTFTSPDCGASPSCQLTLSGTIIGVCDANDHVEVELTIDVIQPEGDNFNVFVNGTLETTVPYDPSGTTTVVVDVPGNGNSNSISVEDELNADCNDEISITTPDCNLPCEITELEAIPAGGGGGPSGIVHTVLVEDFVF